MSILKIPTAKVFEPLLRPARYKGAFGGRGSGKSHFFGELLVEMCQAERGTLAVCIREAQRTLAQSSKRLIESKIASLGVGAGFKQYSDKIATPGDGAIIFRGMRDHTAESIKSLEGFKIAWVHERESSQDWMASLAQGDPWHRVSVHVPSGRGPFKSWEDAAIDALANCAPFLARKKEWSLGATLTNLELYNGAGYANRGVPSPYLWAGTDQYRAGKFVRDGVFDAGAVDSQPGCAGLLKTMMRFDPSIEFTGETGPPPLRSAPVAKRPPPRTPSISSPAKGSFGAFFVDLFKSLTGRK